MQEINILRAEHSLTPRTAAQVKSAFVTSYEAKIDAITEP